MLVLEDVEAEVRAHVEAGPASRAPRQQLRVPVAGLVDVGGHHEDGRAARRDAEFAAFARLGVDVHRAPNDDRAHAVAASAADHAGAAKESTRSAPARRARALPSACWRRYAGSDSSIAAMAESRPTSP